jgi:hypothetical protein
VNRTRGLGGAELTGAWTTKGRGQPRGRDHGACCSELWALGGGGLTPWNSGFLGRRGFLGIGVPAGRMGMHSPMPHYLLPPHLPS